MRYVLNGPSKSHPVVVVRELNTVLGCVPVNVLVESPESFVDKLKEQASPKFSVEIIPQGAP